MIWLLISNGDVTGILLSLVQVFKIDQYVWEWH